MSQEKYSVEQIESLGVACQFESMGGMRDGWIMPDGNGVDYAGFAQLRFEPQTISTHDVEGLKRARTAVADSEFKATDLYLHWIRAQGWVEIDGQLMRSGFIKNAGEEVQIIVSVLFKPNTAKLIRTSVFNVSEALDESAAWEPLFSKWSGGGWYVANVQYPEGSVGCVCYSFDESTWRIVCDPRAGSDEEVTFKTRKEAAHAERMLVRQRVVDLLERIEAMPGKTDYFTQPGH